MKVKGYKILSELLTTPNEWWDISELAFNINLTRKQVYYTALQLPTPPVEMDKNGKEIYIRIAGTEEEIEKYKKNLYMKRYNISKETYDEVISALSTAGWMSVSDISKTINVDRIMVSRALSISDCVESKCDGNICLYRLTEDIYLKG